MNASLTDRYVTATVRDLDEDQRAEVERELRTTIEDMIDGRLEAGAPSRPEAERAVLTELGDPVRLAAGYTGRPLFLIGPRVYPQWRRVMTVLLTTLVPLVTAVTSGTSVDRSTVVTRRHCGYTLGPMRYRGRPVYPAARRTGSPSSASTDRSASGREGAPASRRPSIMSSMVVRSSRSTSARWSSSRSRTVAVT